MNWRVIINRAAAVTAAVVTAGAALARQGTDPLAELNNSVIVPGTKDAAEVLFPALAKMDPSPTSPGTLRGVSMLTTSSREWKDWETWAMGEPQRAALGALKTITDPKSKYLIGLRFGRSESKPEWAEAGLFIDIGEPPLLALAPTRLHYLDRLDHLIALCTVEAERLAAEKKASECSALLINWLRLARIVADRPFAKEKVWAMRQADAALERLGDIACLHPGLFDEKTVQETNRELDPRAIASERVRFPIGERLALRQLIALTLEERGGPKPDAFGPVMGRLTMNRRNPYDLFPQAAHWDQIAQKHAGWFDVREQADKVLNDWQKRWELNNIFDPLMQTETDYAKMDRLRFAMIAQVVDGMQDLFSLRTQVVTTHGGIRSALAVVGYKSVQGQWPPNLYAVQPRFVQTLDNDPWFFERERQVRSNYRYFVPMRDQPVGDRELPKPHAVAINLDQDVEAAAAPDGAGVSDVGDAMLRNFSLQSLSGIAKDVVDSGGGVDGTTLRDRWMPLAKENAQRSWTEVASMLEGMSEAEREAFRQFQRGLANATPQQIGEIVGAATELPVNRPSVERAARSIGLTFDEAKAFLIAAHAALAALPTYKEALNLTANGQSPSTEQIDKAAEEIIGVLTQGDLLNSYVSKILNHFARAAGAKPEGNALTIELTDSDFVIYSVGPDMKPGFARTVGRAGPDILIWPPVLTLERRAAGGK